MNNIHRVKLNNLLSEFNIDELAKSTRYTLRSDGKITPFIFLASFFEMMLHKCYSLRLWSNTMARFIGDSVSFQGIADRLDIRALDFVKALFAKVVYSKTQSNCLLKQISGWSQIKRVLLEDSTCFNLPNALSESYKGASNQQKCDLATARIQLCLDLMSGDYLNIDLQSFRDHDAKHSHQILNYIQAGDLLLRDLAYSVNEHFCSIDKKGAFYISRFKVISKVYTPDNQELIDLSAVLEKVENNGLEYFEMEVVIGGKSKLNTRLICIKLSLENIKKRKVQISKNGNRNKKVNKKTSYLQQWNILITNISKADIEGQKIYELYTLRWHIELIFKTWKSYLRLDSIFKSCQGPNPIKLELLVYLSLLFITLVVNPKFKAFQSEVYKTKQRLLSPMKFIKAIINDNNLLFDKLTPLNMNLLIRNCCYDQRKDRINIYEKIIYL